MKRSILLLFALAGTASLALADRGRPGGGEGDDGSDGGDNRFGDGSLPEFLAKYDLDENGMLDEEERQAAKEEAFLQERRAGTFRDTPRRRQAWQARTWKTSFSSRPR